MKTFEAMARAFADEQIETLFSLMGDANMYWMSSLLDLGGIQNVHVRHENSAVAMADGYARATGKIGVATVTSGPGLVHAGTAIVGASRYGVPLVIFAGDTVPGDASALQYIDHHAFAAVCGVHIEPVVTAARALEAVGAAFRRARALRVPVLLSVPMNLQDEEYPVEYAYVPSRQQFAAVTVPDDDGLDEAAGLIVSARRPVILLGEGARDEATLAEVVQLGDRVGAIYATSLRAKGLLGESPWSVGVAGTFSRPQAEAVFAEADLVIGVGASMNRFTQQEGHLFAQARTLQILDRPLAAVPQAMRVTRFIQGDATATLRRLNAILAESGVHGDGFRSRFQLKAWDPYAENGSLAQDGLALDPRRLIELLEERIPGNALVVSGAGHFWGFVNKGLTGANGKSFMYSLGFGSIGQALPVAIGAAVGRRGEPVVVIDGDSGILMYIADLDTAARLGVSLLAVVMDDDAMGAELHKLRLKGAPSEAALVATPDIATVAHGFGVAGALVRSDDELVKQLDGYDWNSVRLIDVKVSQDVVDVSSVMGNEVVVR